MSTTPGASDTASINVVGHSNLYPYNKIKDAVIYLGGSYYFKNDEENLVKVKDSTGKNRFFRKKSKLVVEITPGKFVHKSFIIRTDDGIL
jgi:hypothetical protein